MKVAQLRWDIAAQLVPRQVQRYEVRQVPQLARNSTRQGLSPVTLPGLVGEVQLYEVGEVSEFRWERPG